MKRLAKLTVLFCLLCAVCAWVSALAEDMPIVRDEPLPQAEAADPVADERARVKHAQELLIELRYLAGGADGILGPNTAIALKAFQLDFGLVADGTLNDVTLQALEVRAEKVDNIKALQQRLIDLGYLTGTADGIYGDHTRKAVKLFQSLNALEASGEVNEATRSAIYDETAMQLPDMLVAGNTGDRVIQLQEKLIQFGFLSGEADGVYGKKTSAAITRFQEHLSHQAAYSQLDILANGKATPVTQMVLLDPSYSSYYTDIAPGEEAGEVQRVERRLKGLGYMDRDEDTHFDDYAVTTAQAFQQAAGLETDVYDKRFIDALFSESAPVAEHYVPHSIAEGDSGLAVREVEEALALAGMTIKLPNGRFDAKTISALTRLHDYLKAQNHPDTSLFLTPQWLSIDAQQWILNTLPEIADKADSNSGNAEDVRRVQRRLHMLYYLSRIGIDGRMGGESLKALKRFQEANGLPATGEVDDATRRAVFSENAVYDKRPYRVEVDLNRQRVYVFALQDDGSYEQIKTFVCSTGLHDATPRGIYLDGFPCNKWHYFKKYSCWAQYSYEIEGDIMFHSVLYSEQDENSLRTGSVNALGSRASHGCIRLEVEAAQWLYENCKRGSLVIVIY